MPALLLLAAAVAPHPPLPAWAGAYVRDALHVADYRAAQADLDGDGRPEVLVYAQGPDRCGSGGCNLYVLAWAGRRVRVVGDVSIARPPIRVLPTASHGWRDLAVLVAGGGIVHGYTARLRFDGRRYPGNPSVPPAEPLKHAAGRIVIDAVALRPGQLPAR